MGVIKKKFRGKRNIFANTIIYLLKLRVRIFGIIMVCVCAYIHIHVRAYIMQSHVQWNFSVMVAQLCSLHNYYSHLV